MTRNLLVLVGLVLLLAPACKSSEPEPHWLKDEVRAQNDQLLIDVTALSLQKSGFPVGTGIDPGQLVAISGWQNSLAPFRGKGWREQCEVRYERLGPQRYQASIRVRHEKNDDILRPLDLTYAKWLPGEDNPDRARNVMQHIRSLLDTNFDVGERR